MAIWSRFFGGAVSTAAGVAVGGSTQHTLNPLVQALANETWALYPDVPPDAVLLAAGVAQGQVDEAAARNWAAETGFGDSQMTAMIAIANTGPGVAAAFALWRRKEIDEAGFRRAAKRGGLEQEWIDALVKVKEEVLDPAELARAIHRGLVPDPGLLEGRLPTGVGNVPAYPVYPIDALVEAEGSGIDHDRLGVMVGLQGNPMGPHEAAQARFRQILTENDYLRAIAEGNTRNEWADAIFEQTRQIPTSRDFLENALRGYRTLPEAIAGAALHGMSAEHATLIYQNQGRPMIPRQINQAMAWGAKFHPEPGEITDPFEASTVEGMVKPAYYEMFKALRYNLPSAFYFRILQQNGILTPDEAEKWYLRLGWPPDLAHQVAQALAGGTGAKSKGETKTELEDEYITGFIDEAEYRQHLTALGLTGHEQDLEVLHSEISAIKTERARAVTDIHAEFKKATLDEPRARAALAALGMHQIAIDRAVGYWIIARDA